MSTDLLFEHFATLATAPDGIARLRELVLQLAVQGKLGTQDAGDEPANILLKKINAEKKQLVKEGKIKKENLLPPTQEKESPYLLPKGWQWATLNDVFLDIRSGGTPSKNNPHFWDGDIYWASVKDLKDRKYLESTQDKITLKGLEECRSKLIPPGNLIICVRMGLGKIAINKVPIAINQDLKAADLSKNVDINYFYNFYRAQTVKGTGMTVDGIRQEKLLQMPFPLPPLAEQHRIVAKVDRLIALCDALEIQQELEWAGCVRFGTASLVRFQNAESPEDFERHWAQVCDAFELILDCPENVAVLRHSILHLAIYGKFKTQETSDKPVKIDNNDSDDSKNRSLGIFKLIDLPKKWVWTKLGNISKVGQGGTPSTNFPEYWNGEVPWLRSGDIKFNRIKNANETISELGLKNSAATLCPIGTVMLAMTGQGVTRGRAAILDIESSANQSCAHIILDKDKMIPEFLFYFFRTEYWNIRTLDKGTGQPGLNTKIIKMFDIPLPPLAEQQRIVAKVDALMALCDALESRLKERAGVQGRLAGAVVKQVAG